MNHPELLSDSPVPSPQDQTEPQRWLERLPQHCAPRNSIRRTLWDKLRPKVETRPAALEAIQDAADHPDDEDALAALRLQLKKLLAEDEALAKELAHLLAQARPAGQTVTASGNRSVAIGGSVSGSVIVTGDRNKINQR